MPTASNAMLIVGGGQAASQAIETLRRGGFQGPLTLVSDEPCLPYQRPPLSKKFLAGEFAPDRLPFRHRPFYDEHHVDVRLRTRAVSIDLAHRRVKLSDGSSCEYAKMLLCMGASARQLSLPGSELKGIHYLRTLTDVESIRSSVKAGARVVIIGGGYIGLETAATLRHLGCAVTVLEMTDRMMNRVVASSVSEFFAREHAAQGVEIVCNTRVTRLEGTEAVERVVCDDGSVHAADLIIVGVGGVPNYQLAMDAGVQCENGVVVDEFCRTSDQDVFAAGDCTYHPSPRFELRVRLESVDNAVEQAKTAALNMFEHHIVHDKVPWFWSDQYQHKLMIVGLNYGYDQQVVRGDPSLGSFSVCYLKGGELVAVESVNSIRDHMAARKLIAERARPRFAELADVTVPLKDLATKA